MTLWINRRLRPGWFSTSGTVLARLFYAAFAAIYLYTLLVPASWLSCMSSTQGKALSAR